MHFHVPTIMKAGLGLGFLMLLGKNRSQIHQDKAMRAHLSEKQVDKMAADSFPASDPPSTY